MLSISEILPRSQMKSLTDFRTHTEIKKYQ